MHNYLIVAGVTRPAIVGLERIRDRGFGIISLIDPRNESMLGTDAMEAILALSDHVISGDHDSASYFAEINAFRTKETRIAGVCPILHLTSSIAAELSELLELPGPGSSIIRRSLNKARVREITARHGLSNPATRTISSSTVEFHKLFELSYPAIIKPVDGYGKFGTSIVDSPTEAKSQILQFRKEYENWQRNGGFASAISDELLVESFIEGPLYSIECYADGDQPHALVAVRRKINPDNPVLELGSSIPGTETADESTLLCKYAEDVLRALELKNGLFHVEVILSTDGPILVEVNPRISGGAIPDLVQLATGINLWDILIDVAIGIRTSPSHLSKTLPSSHSFLAACESFTVPSDLQPDWFEQVTKGAIAGYCDVSPGSVISAMTGNSSTFGVVRFTGATTLEAETTCNNSVRAIGNALGANLWMPRD